MKQIPNLFTLLNLVFGCIAIVFIMQVRERIVIGALFIFFAAAIDFFDGFLARMLKASTDKGKQLDSLSDVVSFGVAPGLILYQLLRIGYTRTEGGLDVSFAYLLPAFIFTCAVAWRLAKFNVSSNQSDNFMGVPSPAAGLVVASLPLIIWYEYFDLQEYFINPWILYGVILLLSFLMVCNRKFIAIKFKDYSFQNNGLKYILILISLVLITTLQWFAIPVIFILYLLFSTFSKTPAPFNKLTHDKTLDITD